MNINERQRESARQASGRFGVQPLASAGDVSLGVDDARIRIEDAVAKKSRTMNQVRSDMAADIAGADDATLKGLHERHQHLVGDDAWADAIASEHNARFSPSQEADPVSALHEAARIFVATNAQRGPAVGEQRRPGETFADMHERHATQFEEAARLYDIAQRSDLANTARARARNAQLWANDNRMAPAGHPTHTPRPLNEAADKGATDEDK